jgi:hypothetical protein
MKVYIKFNNLINSSQNFLLDIATMAYIHSFNLWPECDDPL